MTAFKPMLAATMPDGALPVFPCLVSPKLDGVRALVLDNVVYSRNLKPIPNGYVQEKFGKSRYHGLDGELVVGPMNAPDVFRQTTSGVMSRSGQPAVSFCVFDDTSRSLPFADRYASLSRKFNNSASRQRGIVLVPHAHVKTAEAFNLMEQKFLEDGYEGMMGRAPGGGYKHGRATWKEQTLFKVKRFADAEARVIGVTELMRNDNEATTDELGRTKRSSHQANKMGRDVLGALVVVNEQGVEFQIGTGWTMEERAALWVLSPGLIGRYVKFKYFPTGSKHAPRFPVFLGFRDAIDR